MCAAGVVVVVVEAEERDEEEGRRKGRRRSRLACESNEVRRGGPRVLEAGGVRRERNVV